MNETLRRYTTRAADPVRVEKRADGAKMITGYAAVFYKPDDPGTRFMLWRDLEERIMPGAFDRALKECDPLALFNHDASRVLGRMSSGTLRLSVDACGLRYDITPPDTATAAEVTALVERGDIRGSSFAFIPRTTKNSQEVRNGSPYYISAVEDCDLYDVGPVTFPAYSGTDAGVRSTGDDARVMRDRIVSSLRAAADRDYVALSLAAIDLDDLD